MINPDERIPAGFGITSVKSMKEKDRLPCVPIFRGNREHTFKESSSCSLQWRSCDRFQGWQRAMSWKCVQNPFMRTLPQTLSPSSKDSPFMVYARCLLTYGQPVELSNDPYTLHLMSQVFQSCLLRKSTLQLQKTRPRWKGLVLIDSYTLTSLLKQISLS